MSVRGTYVRNKNLSLLAVEQAICYCRTAGWLYAQYDKACGLV